MILLCILAVAAPAASLVYGYAAGGDNMAMRTPSSDSGARIGKDPVTGARVMRTPEPGERESRQGPQTIIVVPEIRPDHPGNRPPSEPPRTPRKPGRGPR